jgi:hypothetical protein
MQREKNSQKDINYLTEREKGDNIKEYSSCFSPSDSSTLKGFLSSLFK